MVLKSFKYSNRAKVIDMLVANLIEALSTREAQQEIRHVLKRCQGIQSS